MENGNENLIISPENSDYYRPADKKKRGGLTSLIIKLSGGSLGETGANYFLLGFAIVLFIISVIILVVSL